MNRKVLVDHAYIIAGGEITKAARTWLAGELDRTQRSQIIFMDRNDILDIFVTTGLTLPKIAVSTAATVAVAIADDDDKDFFWP